MRGLRVLAAAQLVYIAWATQSFAPSMAPSTAPTSEGPGGGFQITLVPGGSLPIPADVELAVAKAKEIIESIIIGDVVDAPPMSQLWDLAGDSISWDEFCLNHVFVSKGLVTVEACKERVAAMVSAPDLDPAAVESWYNTLGEDVFPGSELPQYAGPVDDIVITYMVATADQLGKGTLAQAAWLLRRPESLDAYRRPISGFLQIGLEAAAKSTLHDNALIIVHEVLHALGVGSNWPTPNGCGGSQAACQRAVDAKRLTLYAYDAGATGTCYASEYYAAACAALPECANDPFTLKLGGAGLLLETTQPDASSGTNCSHWLEYQLRGEVMSGFANGIDGVDADTNVPKVHITGVTLGALRDLGYEVDMAQAESFATVYSQSRLRRRAAAAKMGSLRGTQPLVVR